MSQQLAILELEDNGYRLYDRDRIRREIRMKMNALAMAAKTQPIAAIAFKLDKKHLIQSLWGAIALKDSPLPCIVVSDIDHPHLTESWEWELWHEARRALPFHFGDLDPG